MVISETTNGITNNLYQELPYLFTLSSKHLKVHGFIREDNKVFVSYSWVVTVVGYGKPYFRHKLWQNSNLLVS